MRQEAYRGNILANTVFEQAATANFTDRYELIPVTSLDNIQKAVDAGIGFDERTRFQQGDGYGSLFDGLAFDKENIRTQAVILLDREKETPVGIMSTAILPQSAFGEQRYFQRVTGGVQIRDISVVTGSNLPDFVVVPAWTNVVPEHRGRFALSGFHAFGKVMGAIEEAAPDNTWMEIVAQGLWPTPQRRELVAFASQPVGTFIPESALPFSLDIIGRSSPGARATEKLATKIGLQKREGLGSATSLGPIFTKRIK
jgi:hypothetical protein